MAEDHDDRFKSGPGLIITKKDGRVIRLPTGPRRYTQEPIKPVQ